MTSHGPDNPGGELEYDVIVVGAGAAGPVVARRVASDSGLTVCLLEAGPSDVGVHAVRDTRRFAELLGSEMDYAFEIEHEPDGNDLLVHNAGRVLGGGSSINTCVALRAPDDDLRRWESLAGSEWGVEKAGAALDRVVQTVTIAPISQPHPAAAAFIAAANEQGFPFRDLGGRDLVEGVGWNPFNVRGVERQSSAVVYLREPGLPAGLTVRVNAAVERVVLDDDGAAAGVVVDGRLLRARREVILCAGALVTPKLLMLSGIGPASQLKAHGIDVVVDLPEVGEHLRDHPSTASIWRAARDIVPSKLHGWEVKLVARMDPSSELPDVLVNFGTEAADTFTAPRGYPTAAEALSITAFLGRPRSEGVVQLRSANPHAPPTVIPRYFTDPGDNDAHMLAEALSLARRIAKQPSLAPWIAEELAPGSDVTGTELQRYVKRTAGSMWHPAGTCRMGMDPDSVVAPDLGVRGVSGLRVADASVFPDMVSVNPLLTCFMIGDRCADFVLAPS